MNGIGKLLVLNHILAIFLIVNMVGVEELLCVKNLPFSPKYALGIAEEETICLRKRTKTGPSCIRQGRFSIV